MSYPNVTDRADYYHLGKAAEQGRVLSKPSAAALEDAIVVNEEDMFNRARLLGYYLQPRMNSVECRAARLKHILWFIENAPDCKFAGDKYFAINKVLNSKHYALVKSAWSKQIKLRSDLAQTSINAALFSLEQEPRYSARLLKTALKHFPDNLWAKHILSKARNGKDCSITIPKCPEPFDLEAWRVYANQVYLDTVAGHGERMPALSAKTLEAVVAKYPTDINARSELIGYYRERWRRENVLKLDPDYLHGLVRNFLWCIELIPGSQFIYSGQRFISELKRFASPMHAVVRQAWLNKIKKNPDDSAVLASAAVFLFESGQKKQAERLSIDNAMRGVLYEYEVLGEHAVLLEAAKLQMRAYPHNVDIGLSMGSYYPLGLQKEELAALRSLEKLHPNHKRLRQHLNHLRGMVSNRALWHPCRILLRWSGHGSSER